MTQVTIPLSFPHSLRNHDFAIVVGGVVIWGLKVLSCKWQNDK